jgi:plasmid stability protein
MNLRNRRQLTIWLDEQLSASLKARAAALGESEAVVVRAALRELVVVAQNPVAAV